MITIRNEVLTVQISEHGAEIKSIKDSDGTEYMWSANPEFWARTSPVLFPVVGSYRNKHFTYEGRTYEMGQHGFARDSEFEVVSADTDRCSFRLTSSEETLSKYPMEFELVISYELTGRSVKVSWKVMNPGAKPLYFSIGAHPAFVCPLGTAAGERRDYYIRFDGKPQIRYNLLGSGGCVADYDNILMTDGGYVPISDDLFERDALIIEGDQVHSVSLCTPDKKPYVTVDFETPLFGVWSPKNKADGTVAPFVCIEPWYGRADAVDYEGDVSAREYGNCLEKSKEFNASYTMTFAPAGGIISE